MAILFHELLREFKEFTGVTVRIIGTGVDQRSLAAARLANYSEHDLTGVDKRYVDHYFTKQNDRYEVIPEIVDMVSFGHFNLIDEGILARRKESFAPSM